MKEKNIRKRLLSMILALIMVVSNFIVPSSVAQAADLKNAVYDQFLVKLATDEETIIPVVSGDGFGTAGAAGRIWTDKSVEAKDDGFEVTLSALAQEYMVTDDGNSGGYHSSKAPAVDVTFVLDMSGSMKSTGNAGASGYDIKDGTKYYYRVEAMNMAVNKVIKTVMDANPKNRVAVHWFTGTVESTHLGTLMEMGSYTVTNNEDYIKYTKKGTGTSATFTLETNSSLNRDGETYPKKDRNADGGTPTQDGIMYGVSNMIADIGKETKGENDPQRKPFVLVLSDGSAIQAKTDWYNIPALTTPDAYNKSNKNQSDNNNHLPKTGTVYPANTGFRYETNGTKEITAATILTGRFMKDKLDTAYQNYNNDNTVKSQFYTVGLGSESDIYGVKSNNRDYSKFAWAGLDPKTVFEKHNATGDLAQAKAKEVHDEIKTHAYNYQEKDYSNDYSYSDYYTFADTFDKLMGAFDQLATDAVSASKIPPILNLPTGTVDDTDKDTKDITRAINFVDEIGNGFNIEVDTLKIGNSLAQKENAITNGAIYGFSGYESKVAIRTEDGVTTISWFVNAEDLKEHIYSYQNREDPTEGEYNKPEKGAFKLNYKVVPSFEETPDSISQLTYYSNAMENGEAKTVAYFNPPNDSPYYKAFREDPNKENIVSKTNSLAGTASYISKESISDGTISIRLGNNGGLDVEMGIVKSGPEVVKVNDDIKYSVTIYNYTDTEKTVSVKSENSTKDSIVVPANGNSKEEFTKKAPGEPTERLISGEAILKVDGKEIKSNTVDTKVVNQIYTVTYDKNGGNTEANPNTKQVVGGSSVGTLPTPPTRDDYDFKGWNIQADGGGADFTDSTSVNEDITVYAQWQLKEYEVTFNPKGGKFTDGTEGNKVIENVEHGTKVGEDKFPTNLEKDGYDFKGWHYKDGDDNEWSFTKDTVVTGDIEVYARWEEKEYTVTFEDGEGNKLEEKTVKYNEPVGELPGPPTKEGYTFTGWSTESDGTGEYFDKNSLVTGNITLYPQYTQNKTYTITYDKNGGDTEATPGSHIIEENKTVGTLPNPPTKEGYTFIDWNTQEDGTGINFYENTPVTVTQTVYAQWDINKYKVTFDPIEGEFPGISTDNKVVDNVEHGTSVDGVAFPINPEKEGYDFEGWYYKDRDDNERSFTRDTVITGDIIVYAKWEEKSKPNIPPTVPNYSIETNYGKEISGRVEGKDDDGDNLTYSKGTNPSNGKVKVNPDGSWTYTPNLGFKGEDKFTLIVDDGKDGKTISTITVIVKSQETVILGIEMKANPSTVVADGESTSILTARVTDSKNNPVAGVTVKFTSEMGTFPEGTTAITNDNGYASVVFKSEKIEDTITRYILVKAEVQDEEKGLQGEDNIMMTFEPSSIKGVVTDNKTGKPIEGTKVVITKDFDGDGEIDFYGEAITDAKGEYKIAIPKGDVTYDVEITKEIELNEKKEYITFNQKAKAEEIKAKEYVEFPATRTFTGIILIKDKNGKDKIAGKDEEEKEIKIKQLSPDGTTSEKGKVDNTTGIFSIENLVKGQTYEFVMITEVDGQELLMGKIKVTLDDGEISIHEELIDPYGTIRDSKTGNVLGSAKVELFYADTQRNKDNGRTPGTSVVLPKLAGFAPNDNKNSQSSTSTLVFNNHPEVNDHGNFAWMVFPETDYYIVGTKTGYETYRSGTISVEFDVVKHDFAMIPISSSGGNSEGEGFVPTPTPTSTKPKEEPKPDNTPVDLVVDITTGQRNYLEETEQELDIDYINKTDNLKNVEIVVTIPKGAEVIDTDGGTIVGDTIVWKLGDLEKGNSGTKKPIIKLPQISSIEETITIKVGLTVNGKSVGDPSTIDIAIFSNRFGNGKHSRYIQGYPDGKFKVDKSITRAEIAVIFARILKLEDLVRNEEIYEDVKIGRWYARGVEASTRKGLFEGYNDGGFRPDQPITRGELATVIARFLELPNTPPVKHVFKDTSTHWALNYIGELYRNNVITGYTDGTFKPEEILKRSEAVTMINKMLNRGPLKGVEPSFPDVNKDHWAVGDVEESTRSHEYYRNPDGSETHIKTILEKLNF